MGNFSIEIKTLWKDQVETIELWTTVSEKKNAFNVFNYKATWMKKESVDLKTGQWNDPNWTTKRKKNEKNNPTTE